MSRSLAVTLGLALVLAHAGAAAQAPAPDEAPHPTPSDAPAPSPHLAPAPPPHQAPAPSPHDAPPADDAGVPGVSPRPALEEPLLEPPPLPEAHRPTLEVSLTPAEGVHTGDLVTLTIRARALSGDDVSVPDTSFEGRAHLELLDARVEATPGDDGHTTFVLTAELLATDPGEEDLGPIRVRVVTRDGVMGFVETSPVVVRVASLVANEPNAEPKPPTDPVPVLEDDDTLLWVLGILAAMVAGALVALLVARWWSRRERPPVPPPPPRPPWEVAIERLEAQKEQRVRMIERGEGAAWVDGVSDAVREYLGRRYGFDGLESTTDEILAQLRRATVAGVSVEEIQLLLTDYDLVKFAKEEVDTDASEGLLAAAYRIVRATSPRPEAHPHAPAAMGASPGPDAPPAPPDAKEGPP